MKKIIYRLSAALAILLSVAGCTEDQTQKEKKIPYITVDEMFLNAGPDAATFTVNITANIPWTIKSSSDWCSASPAAGLGDETTQAVTISVKENSEYDDRSAVLSVEGEGATAEEITVTQKKQGALIVTPTAYEIPAQGDTIEVEIVSNLNYKIVLPSGVDWIKEIEGSRALDTQVKTYAIAANDTYGPRSTVIRVNEVSAGAAKSESIQITQAQNSAVILSTPTFEVGAEGGDIQVKVKSNIEYTTEILCDWIVSTDSRALTEKKLGFKVLANEDFDAREGKIVIVNDICNDTVTVSQAALKMNDIQFTDRKVKAIIIEDYDTNKDGKIDSDEAAAVTELVFCIPNNSGIRTGLGITSLGGLEYLRNLEYLDIARNSVKNIDLTANKKLKYIDCELNKAETVAFPTSATYIDCSHNDIYDLDLTGMTELEHLDCGENKITTLDLSSCAELKTLACYNNYNLATLDLSANTQLEQLLCYTNIIEKIDLSGLKNLKLLNCVYNKIKEIDLSANTELEALYCSGNALTSLNVSGKSALRSLSCDNNKLTSLNVSGCTSLLTLYCWNNSLTTLNAAGLSSLEFLGCAQNQLTTLNVSGCSAVRSINCQNNKLSALDVKDCKAVNNIYCHDNQITELDLSNNTALTGLHASSNKLSNIDLSKNTALNTMYVNKMSTLSTIRLWDECDTDSKYFYKDDKAAYVGGKNGNLVTATMSSSDFKWNKDDKISVMSASNTDAEEYVIVSGEGTSTAKFSGNKVDGTTLYAVYPSSVKASLSQNTVSLTIPAIQQYKNGWNTNVLMAGKNASAGAEIKLSPLSGIVCLNITGTETISNIKFESTDNTVIAGKGTVDMSAATPALSLAAGGSTSINVNGVNAALSSAGVKIYIPVAPATIKNPKITLYDTKGTGMTVTSDATLTLKAGQTSQLNIAYVPSKVESIDLSASGLANCYIVSRPGSYSLDTKKVDGSVVNGASADWVWMSQDALISNVNYNNGMISFSASGESGNGLVALLDAAGNIVWSWHIWCTDAPEDQKWNANTWMDRNLGATSVTPDDVNTYGMLYQWGRKDPIIGTNTAGNTNGPAESEAFDSKLAPVTVINESVVGKGNGWANIFGQVTVEQAARYPMCLYTYKVSRSSGTTNPEGAYGGKTTGQTYGDGNPTMADWCVGGANDRWYNKSVTTSGKTTNDPCPAGYMVPTVAQMNADFIGSKYFTSEGKSTATNGRTFTFNGQTSYLPATGVRFSAYTPEGADKFIGNTAIYWNSGVGSTASIGAFMAFTNGNVGSTCGAVMWKSFACPVRCVAE